MLAIQKTCRSCGRRFAGGEAYCPVDGARLESPSRGTQTPRDPLLGQLLGGRYRVVRVVGEGGMGIVYEAVHELIDRRVALKVLRDDFSRRTDVVERFRREARSASRIGHPNIVDVLDFGETPAGASYFVMEMLEGEDLADTLARFGSLEPGRAASIALQCCRALGAAHSKDIVHRDLKPENIFLISRDGAPDFVKIVDFGVAKMNEVEPVAGGRRKLTRTGMLFGTPEYMSPEQAQGLPSDHRVDIYALGVILYELLAGRVPFEGDSFMAVLTKHASKPVPTLRESNPQVRVSPELEDIVYRALRKTPLERFSSMGELADALLATPEMVDVANRASFPGVLAARAPGPDDALTTEIPAPLGASGSSGTFDALVPRVPRTPAPELPSHSRVAPASRGHAPDASASFRVPTELSSAPPAPHAPELEELHEPTTAELADMLEAERRLRRRIAAVAIAMLAAVAAYWALPRSWMQAPVAESPTPANGASGEAPALAGTASGQARQGAAAAAPGDLPRGSSPELQPPTRVRVSVTTRPSEASIETAAGKALCAATPCVFELPRGERVTLVAAHGTLRARTTLEADADRELHLVLREPVAREASPQRSDADARGESEPRGGTPKEPAAIRVPDDLKVPPIFRR